jgi:DNA-binding MarR family transcriptional regulator
MCLDAVQRRLSTRLSRTLEGTGLPQAQFLVLNHLASVPDRTWTVTGLAAALETGQPGVSKILQRLVAKGHLSMDADAGDGRVKHHRITASGQAAHQEAFRRLTLLVEDIFRGWQDGDIDNLHGLLYRLKSSLRDPHP